MLFQVRKDKKRHEINTEKLLINMFFLESNSKLDVTIDYYCTYINTYIRFTVVTPVHSQAHLPKKEKPTYIRITIQHVIMSSLIYTILHASENI